MISILSARQASVCYDYNSSWDPESASWDPESASPPFSSAVAPSVCSFWEVESSVVVVFDLSSPLLLSVSFFTGFSTFGFGFGILFMLATYIYIYIYNTSFIVYDIKDS